MGNQTLRVEYGIHANESMKAYAPDKIWDEWERVLKEVILTKY